MPAAERQRETGTANWLLRQWLPHNRPDRDHVPARKGADAGLVGLRRKASQDARTEGQVGHHERHPWHASASAVPGERTRGRLPGLGPGGLGPGRGKRKAATAADLRGIAGRGPQEGPQPAEDDAPVPKQRAGERAAGHGGQRWPQDGRGRRAHRARGLGEGRHGRLAPTWRVRVEAPARQAGIRPEEQREAPRPGDPRDRRPGAASPGRQRAGARVGGPVRAEVLRVPARQGMP